VAESALTQLAQVYENRRQYPTAAKNWQESIKRFGPGQNNWKNDRLDQIIGNWGTFEGSPRSPPARGERRVPLSQRQESQVRRRAIKVPELLAEIKAYLKSDPGNRIDWNKINIGNIGYRLVNEGEAKYLAKRPPPGSSTSSRERIIRPPDYGHHATAKAGAYLVTATMADGNVSKIILWVADTAIVRKQLDGKTLYYIADAVTGSPIPTPTWNSSAGSSGI
jgi:hypothetical protein